LQNLKEAILNIRKIVTAVVVCILIFAAMANKLQAAPIYIPNASFELPQTTFADPCVDFWQMPPTPWWYDESGGYLWIQLTGVFLNLPPGDPDHIDNCDANQAVWFFALPEVELFQELTTIYEVGQSYNLTVGIIGGGGNMKDDVPIDIRLYYRNGADEKVTVGAKTYTYDLSSGYVKHFIDVQLDIPQVKETDPWAGKNIGVQLISALTFPEDLDPETGRAGGYWDLDNVRLKGSWPDLTGDWFVNLKDFAVMARQWRLCTGTTADLTGDGCVTMKDLKILVGPWLESTLE
jgi:hypothetical protein